MANRNLNPEIEALEAENTPVEEAQAVTFNKAVKALKDASGKTEVAQQRVANPEVAYAKLQEALKMVKSYFGKTLKINLNEISFQKFGGNRVGESTEKGAFIDPVMLLHPAVRLAHVIAHELAHKKKSITNEGLVEGYVHAFFGEDGTNHTYEESVVKFEEFSAKCANKISMEETTKKIYEHYYAGRFEKIYEMFEKNYLKNLKTDAEKDEAFQLFREVFPELRYVSKEEPAGDFGLNRPAANDDKEYPYLRKAA